MARHDGRVVFVRHTLPGERVLARVTGAGGGQRFWRADAVRVLEPSPDRVPSVWSAAGPGGVGGGELAHVAFAAQRSWKAAVVREQLHRLAGLDGDVVVEAAPGDGARDGLGWRTRIELVADDAGRAGMHRYRSRDVVALGSMPLANEAIAGLRLFERTWPAGARITAVAPAGGDRPVVLVDGEAWAADRADTRPNARTSVREVVYAGGREYRYRVAAAGFWQVHRDAPAMLVGAVLDALAATDLHGSTVLDLYAGAGLFTQPLADLVGPGGAVLAVEGDERAARDARRGAHALPQVTLRTGDVERVLSSSHPSRVAAVVLDPPRVGAGRRVVEQVAALAPRAVVYVACDPAALARDVRYFAEGGYGLASLRAFDLFPHTHHVECVAHLVPAAGGGRHRPDVVEVS